MTALATDSFLICAEACQSQGKVVLTMYGQCQGLCCCHGPVEGPSTYSGPGSNKEDTVMVLSCGCKEFGP